MLQTADLKLLRRLWASDGAEPSSSEPQIAASAQSLSINLYKMAENSR